MLLARAGLQLPLQALQALQGLSRATLWAAHSSSSSNRSKSTPPQQQQQQQQRCLDTGAAAPSSSSTTTSSASEEPYDVCVVGAGMVGAALVALLRANPLTASMRVALIDQQPPPMTLEAPLFPDLRVSTITPANMQLLQQAGAWWELQALAPTFQHMQVWEFGGPGFISWHSSEVGLPDMGCVVENRLLQAALLRAATGTATAGSSSSSSSGGGGGCLDILCPQSVQAVTLPTTSSGGPPRLQELLQQAARAPGTTTTTSSSSTTTTTSSSSSSVSRLAEVQLANGSRLRCRLLVAADGARSRVRQLAGFRTVGWSYNQRGLVASVATAEPSDTAWQRFLPTGPLALLPVRAGYSNVVWTVPPALAQQLEGYSPAQFADAVNEAMQPHPSSFGPAAAEAASSAETSSAAAAGPVGGAAAAAAGALLQGVAGSVLRSAPVVGPLLAGAGAAAASAASAAGAVGSGWQGDGDAGAPGSSLWRQPPLVTGWVGSSPKSFPLQMQHSGRYVAPHLALIGDAAHAVHPMAGQGVNLGLGDAAALAAALAAAREVGQDVGDVAMLQARYEGPRQRANLAMMGALEVLWRGFGVQQGAVGAVRAAGLGLLNGAGPLKNRIMQYAMGLSSSPS